jgi:hypothetical protein
MVMLPPSMIFRPSPLLSSMARFSRVKSLALTSSPSAPLFWPLKDRMVLSLPAPRMVTPLTRRLRLRSNWNLPAGNLDHLARLGVDQALEQLLLVGAVLRRDCDRRLGFAAAAQHTTATAITPILRMPTLPWIAPESVGIHSRQGGRRAAYWVGKTDITQQPPA